MENSHCPVCGVVADLKTRCGAFVCEACKRFFLRNRSKFKITLQCDKGSGSCYEVLPDQSSPKVNWFGSILRQICPRCRYNRCLQLGMGQNHRISQSAKQLARAEDYQIIKALNSHESSRFENDLNAVVESSRKMLINIRAPISMNAVFSVSEETTFWQNVGLPLFEYNVNKLGTYVKALPGYNSIAMPDRIVLFTNAYIRLIYAMAATLDGQIAAYVDLINDTAKHACENVASYDRQQTFILRKTVHDWQPCQAELAILLSLLFLNDRDVRLIDSETIASNVLRVKQVHRALLMKKFGKDFQLVEARERKMADLMQLIEHAALGRIIPLREAFHRNWPILAMSSIVSEFFGVGKHRLEYQQSRQISIPSKRMPWD